MKSQDWTMDEAASGAERGRVASSPVAKSPLDPSVRRDLVMRDPGLPEAQGLYDPSREHDACGVGFVANMHNAKSHDIVKMGLEILLNLDHRGATGADPKAGDGCGMLLQIPHDFFVAQAQQNGFTLPGTGDYAIGVMFLPRDAEARADLEAIIAETVASEGFPLLGWRDVPVDSSVLGESVVPSEPRTRQIFIGRGAAHTNDEIFERRLYVLRKTISNAVISRKDPRFAGYYTVSMSSRTIVYKGLLLAGQLGTYFHDLRDPRLSRRSRSCTSASRPTRSRPGSWRTPIASSRITARSTRCAATSTGWRRGRRRSSPTCSATTSRSCGRSPTRASPTPPASTTRSSSWCRAATRSPTP